MTIDITSLDVEVNFWQLYPEFKAIEPFSSWYQGDKSKLKDLSSKKMWFIALGYHPSSTISRMEESAKQKLLSEAYMKDKQYYVNQQASLEDGIPVFMECTSTATQRQLNELELLFDKRGEFIRSQEYCLENFEDLDKMFAATEKIQSTFDKLKTKLAAEAEAGASRGQKNLSAGDMNLG